MRRRCGILLLWRCFDFNRRRGPLCGSALRFLLGSLLHKPMTLNGFCKILQRLQ